MSLVRGYCRCYCGEERCGTREDSRGRSGLWAASSNGCSPSSTSMTQVSERCVHVLKIFFLFSNKKNDARLFVIICWYVGIICCFVFLGQVDWAALAQAWIAQKESTGTQPHNIQPNGQDLPGHDSGPPGPPAPPTNHGTFQGEPGFGRMWQPGKRWRGWRGYFDLTVGFPESHFSGQFCSN